MDTLPSGEIKEIQQQATDCNWNGRKRQRSRLKSFQLDLAGNEDRGDLQVTEIIWRKWLPWKVDSVAFMPH